MSSIYQIIAFIIIGFLYAITLLKSIIALLKRFKYGQSIREEGPNSHKFKKGTPTMGGIAIVFITLILFLIIFIFNYKSIEVNIHKVLIIVLPFLLFFIIGLIDDILIIKRGKNDGLKPSLKFILQLIVSALTYIIVLNYKKSSAINFFGTSVDIGFLYGIFIVIAYTGFSNATNITDGLDGLLGGSTLVVCFAILILSIIKKEKIVTYFSMSFLISLLAYLMYNFPKASIFMGDTGSLTIGSVIFSMLIILDMEILIFVFGGLFLFETVSVILQVWFFKKTKGERLFKMAPFHHHLELCGTSEIKIDILFWFICMILSIIGLYLGVLLF